MSMERIHGENGGLHLLNMSLFRGLSPSDLSIAIPSGMVRKG
jgi:hypothetical protein